MDLGFDEEPTTPVRRDKPRRRINRHTKKEIIFDPASRRDFLTGFHKRKLERKKKAQNELIQQLKEEKKKIREKARNLHKTLLLSHKPLPELEEFLETEEVLEFPEHSVSIQELTMQHNKKEEDVDNADKDDLDEEENENQETDIKNVKKAVRLLASKEHRKNKIVKVKNKMNQTKNKHQARIKKLKKRNPKVLNKRAKHKGKRSTMRNE